MRQYPADRGGSCDRSKRWAGHREADEDLMLCRYDGRHAGRLHRWDHLDPYHAIIVVGCDACSTYNCLVAMSRSGLIVMHDDRFKLAGPSGVASRVLGGPSTGRDPCQRCGGTEQRLGSRRMQEARQEVQQNNPRRSPSNQQPRHLAAATLCTSVRHATAAARASYRPLLPRPPHWRLELHGVRGRSTFPDQHPLCPAIASLFQTPR